MRVVIVRSPSVPSSVEREIGFACAIQESRFEAVESLADVDFGAGGERTLVLCPSSRTPDLVDTLHRHPGILPVIVVDAGFASHLPDIVACDAIRTFIEAEALARSARDFTGLLGILTQAQGDFATSILPHRVPRKSYPVRDGGDRALVLGALEARLGDLAAADDGTLLPSNTRPRILSFADELILVAALLSSDGLPTVGDSGALSFSPWPPLNVTWSIDVEGIVVGVQASFGALTRRILLEAVRAGSPASAPRSGGVHHPQLGLLLGMADDLVVSGTRAGAITVLGRLRFRQPTRGRPGGLSLLHVHLDA